MVGFRRPFATQTLVPPNPVSVVSVETNLGPNIADWTFDSPMEVGTGDAVQLTVAGAPGGSLQRLTDTRWRVDYGFTPSPGQAWAINATPLNPVPVSGVVIVPQSGTVIDGNPP